MSEGMVRAHTAARGIKVGDVIADNDPRMYSGRRRLTIGRFFTDGSRVYARCASLPLRPEGRAYDIRLDRIHTDGKPRRSGFSLVRNEEESVSDARAGAVASNASA